MQKKVLVIGELNVDMILNHIEGFPKIGAEILASDMNLVLGSSSAIFASNLSSQGVDVSFLGVLGKDQYGTLAIESLKGNGVDTSNIIYSETHKTGITVIMNYDMDRAMVTYPGAMTQLSLNHIQNIDLSPYQHVHISSVFLQPLLKDNLEAILTYLKSKGLTISLDPQWDPKEEWDLDLKKLLPLIDVFLPNVNEFRALTGSENINQGITQLAPRYNIIAVKQGEDGAVLFANDQEPIYKAAFINSQVVDCIGAGDSFDAGFVYGFIQDLSLEKCLERGNILGAANTTAPGGTSVFRDFNKTKEIVKAKFNYNI